jgi:hypothetical protein
MVASTSIDVTHKVVEGWHVFESEQMPGLYIAHRDARRAYKAVGPAIEKLVGLDTGMVCRAVPDVPFNVFISKARAELTNAAAQQRFNLFKQAA